MEHVQTQSIEILLQHPQTLSASELYDPQEIVCSNPDTNYFEEGPQSNSDGSGHHKIQSKT